MSVSVCFLRADETAVYRIKMYFPVLDRPQRLLDDLAAAGFTYDPVTAAPAERAMRYRGLRDPRSDNPLIDAGYDQQMLDIRGPEGRAGDGTWTNGERKRHLRAARVAMRRHGIDGVPYFDEALNRHVPNPDRAA